MKAWKSLISSVLTKRVHLTEQFYWANLANSGRFIRIMNVYMNFDVRVSYNVSISSDRYYLQITVLHFRVF